MPGGVVTGRTLPATTDKIGQLLGSPASVASLITGAEAALLGSCTGMFRVMVAPLPKVKVTCTVWAGYSSADRPVRLMFGPAESKPTCTDWPAGIGMGVLAADSVAEGDSVAEAEPVAGAELLLEAVAELLGLPVTVLDPGAETVALPELVADGEPDSDGLADGNSELAEEALLTPVLLTWALLATGLVTDCNCSVCGPLLMITSWSSALPPLAVLPPCSSATTAAARIERKPASADAPSIAGRWLTVWASWPAAQPAISSTLAATAVAAPATRRIAPARPARTFATLPSSSALCNVERP